MTVSPAPRPSNDPAGALSPTSDNRSRALSARDDESGVMRLGCVVSAILLGQAALLAQPARSGPVRFPAAAMVLAVIATVILITSMAFHPRGAIQRLAGRSLWPVLGLGVLLGLWRLPMIGMFIRYPALRPTIWPFVALAGVAIVLAAVVLLARSAKWVSLAFVLLVAFHALMGAWYLEISSEPHVDVYLLQKLSCKALLEGRNPYAITFPDIYGPDSGYYRPGLVVNGRVQFGYDYPPLCLLLALPGYAMGDLRYSHLLALSLSALLLGYARPGRIAKVAAAMMLFTPDMFHQLENGWTEPFVLLGLCAAVFCASRRWMVPAAVTVGLFLVSKQYALLAAPAAWLLIPRPVAASRAVRWGIIALVAGTIVTLPFILWDPHAFFHSMTAPFVGVLRMDSVSFLPLIERATGWRPNLVPTVVAAAGAAALALARSKPGPCAFAAGAALILLGAFLFSTQSFGNYYFLAAGTLCAAVAGAAKTPQPKSAPATTQGI